MFDPGKKYFVEARNNGLFNLIARLMAGGMEGRVRKALSR
jgi:hypothetical protein